MNAVPVPSVTVAAPADIVDHLAAQGHSWLTALVWDPRNDADDAVAATQFWVPPYTVASSEDLIRGAFDRLTDLRVVQLMSAGVDPWYRLVPSDVTLCSGRGIHGGSTAELAVALTLALMRGLPDYVEHQQRHDWSRLPRHESVIDRNVLMIGAGDIGQRVAATLSALDASVTLVGRTPRDGVIGMSDVPSRLPSTDIVVIAVPHTPETEGLVDADFLGALPDGALVVNVARGAVVDTAALLAEVSSGRLQAGLDVTDPEPLPADHPLWTAPGVLITPHVGGGVEGWLGRAQRLIADQVTRLHLGEPLRNVVSAGY
jgi:phosphoglycerate dehydrogenase-like enzyme